MEQVRVNGIFRKARLRWGGIFRGETTGVEPSGGEFAGHHIILVVNPFPGIQPTTGLIILQIYYRYFFLHSITFFYMEQRKKKKLSSVL